MKEIFLYDPAHIKRLIKSFTHRANLTTRFRMEPCDFTDTPMRGETPISYAQLRDRAEDACRHCDMVEKCILAVVDGKLPSVFGGPQDAADRVQILDELVFYPRALDCRIKRYDYPQARLGMLIKGKRLDIELFRDPEEQPDFTVQGIEFKESAQLGPTTNSDMTLHNAKRWLDKCENEHPDCGKQTPGYYPTRLLDLRGDRIRVIETDKAMAQNPYVCLSHRWGIKKHGCLESTTETIEDHKKGIPYNHLPKTFQDAVYVCRRLAVDYLWIDSLCVLQDSLAENMQETQVGIGTAMGGIYQNSYFTICASMSTSMVSGFFSGKESASFAINVVDDDDNEAVLRIRESSSLLHQASPTDLHTRGWTFQEYLLPSRVLEFHQFEISWRCRKLFECECDQINESYDWRRPFIDETKHRTDLDITRGEWWANMVRYYSTRSLTNEQDKLPALSCMAQIYYTASGDTYLAGIWETSLPHSLCWYYCRNPYSNAKAMELSIGCRPREYRAPSWSWASIDTSDGGECYFWGVDRDELAHMGIVVRKACTLHEAACEPATSDPFGRVSYGRIKLGVILITAYIDGYSKLKRERQTKAKMGWTLSNVKEGLEDGSDVSSDVDLCFTDCSWGECGLDMGDEVKCAPILESFDLDKGDPKELFRACLVLKHLKDQEYQRIGFCVLRTKDPEWSYPVAKTKHRHSLRYTEARGHEIEIV